MKNKQLLLDEAVIRMKLMGINNEVIERFNQNQSVMVSYQGLPYTIPLIELSRYELQQINEWKEQNDGILYHIIKCNTNFGELLNLLYVSVHEDEWKYDIEDIRDKQPFVYVINLTIPLYSEYGRIGIKSNSFGTLARTF